MADVSAMTFERRLGEVLERTAGKVGPAIAAQLRALIEPKSLTIMAGVLIAWVVSHGFAVGEIIDFIVAVVGVFSIGLAVFSGIDELYEFARDTYSCGLVQRTTGDPPSKPRPASAADARVSLPADDNRDDGLRRRRRRHQLVGRH